MQNRYKDGFLMYFSCFKNTPVKSEKDTFSLNTFLYFLNFELHECIVHLKHVAL